MGAPGAPGSGRGKEGGEAWCRGVAGVRGRNTAVPTHPALYGIGGWIAGGGGRHDSVVLCFVISVVRSDIFVG